MKTIVCAGQWNCDMAAEDNSRDDASSGVYESDDGTKCDSANEDFLSAEDEEPLLVVDEYDLSVGSWDSRPSNATSSVSTSVRSASSDALECAASLAKGIRALSCSQEENWRKVSDLIEKKDTLIRDMTDLVKIVKNKMSSTSLHSSEGQSANLCVSCSRPIRSGPYEDKPTPLDPFWTKHPIDFIEDLFHGDEEWRCAKGLYAFDADANAAGEWNLGDEENTSSDLLNLDFTNISVPRGFENPSCEENTDDE